jgi:hypothetical protein
VKLRVTASFVDRPGQSCLPVHVGFAPKADLRLGPPGRRRAEVGRTPVTQAPKLGSFESCAINLPTTNGLPLAGFDSTADKITPIRSCLEREGKALAYRVHAESERCDYRPANR